MRHKLMVRYSILENEMENEDNLFLPIVLVAPFLLDCYYEHRLRTATQYQERNARYDNARTSILFASCACRFGLVVPTSLDIFVGMVSRKKFVLLYQKKPFMSCTNVTKVRLGAPLPFPSFLLVFCFLCLLLQ